MTADLFVAAAGQDLAQLVEYIRQIGVVGLLVVAFIGLYRKWWVPGWLYRQTLAERDEWKRAALRGTNIAERAAELAETESTKEPLA